MFQSWKFSLSLVSVAAFVLSVATATANPYEDVDWEKFGQFKANFHTHTVFSGSRMNPDEVIDRYRELGYSILSLTDHNRTTWPWSQFGRHPEQIGMLPVQGAELSRHHHLGSYFCNVSGGNTVEETLAQIRERGGLAVMFHPGRYRWSAQEYVKLYQQWDELIGMEVYNRGDNYPEDRALWDAVLTELMPDRPVWGYSNDDMYTTSQLGRNFTMFLLPELTEEALRDAMVKGCFYFSYVRQPEYTAPAIQSIDVDMNAGIIEINAKDYDKIVWISEGREIHEGKSINLKLVEGVGSYVRARLIGEDSNSFTYTQPFSVLLEDDLAQ